MPASITLARMVTLVLIVTPGMAWASQFDYLLYASIEHSNNINLTTDNPISQNIFIPGLSFTYTQQGSVLQANVQGLLEYRDYLGNRFSNQTQTQLAGQGNWTVLPQRLDFSVADYAGVQPVDSLASDAPGNQQQTNVLALGPTLHLRFGEAMRGQIELRYINSYASKTDDFNSSRGMAAFRLFRDISPTDQLSMNVETQHVDFSNSSDFNYNRNEVYAGYTSKLAKFDLDVALGWSQLDFPHLPSASSPLVRLTLGWRPTERSTFGLTGAYQYSDAAQNLMQAPGQAPSATIDGINMGSMAINSQVYLERSLEASYTFHSERWSLFIAPLYQKLHYLNDPTFDQIGRGGSIDLGYLLRPTLTLTAFATGERFTYQSLDRRDDSTQYGLDLNRQWTSHWSAHVSLTQQRRSSDVPGQSYRETQIFFGVVFHR